MHEFLPFVKRNCFLFTRLCEIFVTLHESFENGTTIPLDTLGTGRDGICEAARNRSEDGLALVAPLAQAAGGRRGCVWRRCGEAEARGEILSCVPQYQRRRGVSDLQRPAARCVANLRRGEHSGRDGRGEYAAIQRTLPRAGRHHLADGRAGACRFGNRLARQSGGAGRRKRGNHGAELDDGGRHHEFLHLATAGAHGRENERNCAWNQRGRRVGIH